MSHYFWCLAAQRKGTVIKMNNQFEFREIMTDVLTAEPISVMGGRALTALHVNMSENEFLSKLYVKPFTSALHQSTEGQDFRADPDVGYTTAVELNALVSAKNIFESHLCELRDSLFIIKGGTGSGKTTYAHHLKKEFDNLEFIFCDFEKAKKSISLFEQAYDFKEKFDSNVWKFVSIIAAQISYTLHGGIEDGFNGNVDFIKKVFETYKHYFSINDIYHPVVDEQDMIEFFDELGKSYGRGSTSFEDFKRNMKNRLVDKFEEFSRKNQKKEAVTYVCSILIRIFRCLNHIYHKKFVCAIDNIEYFLPYDVDHPIQDCELQTILDGISAAISQIRPTIQEWKVLFPSYTTFFGFLLMTRDTTASLVEYRHYDDFAQEREIDITQWFCANDIFERKIQHFKDLLSLLKDNPYFIAFNYVMRDMSPFNWGMHNTICKMYNYNYRRITINLVNALADQPPWIIENFNECWVDAYKDNSRHSLRHLCRKLILRIILDYIQRTKFFGKQILVEIRDASERDKPLDNLKSSYARKITTTLYRSDMEGKEYLTFPQLISSILKYPYLEQPSMETQIEHIEYLASIIFSMNEPRNPITNWVPLVMLKFDTEQVYTKENLAAEMVKQWKDFLEKKTDMESCFTRYGVRITEAGSFFVKILPDFEYFACRFAPQYPALIARENLRACTDKSGNDSYRCLEAINIVKDNAFKCIDEVIKRDDEFFKSVYRPQRAWNRFFPLYADKPQYKWIYVPNKNSSSLLPHPLRILNHQIGYLQDYKEYVEVLPDRYFEKPEARTAILNGLVEEIGEYKSKLQEIVSENPDYFNKK